MDNNNSNTPDNIYNRCPGAVTPNQSRETAPTQDICNAVNTDEYNEELQHSQSENIDYIKTDVENTAENTPEVDGTQYTDYQKDTQPISEYADNMHQNLQNNNQPIVDNTQKIQVPHLQFDDQPQNNVDNQNKIQQPQVNNQSQSNGYQPNSTPSQNFVGQQPIGAYRPNPTPPQQFVGQQPMGVYQSATVPQHLNNQPHINTATGNTASIKNTTPQQNPYAGNNTQNVYTQPNNGNIPHIEYIPYVPGTPLPNGVTPQFINGGWYYPMVINQKPKKKMATSVKVLVGIIAGLIVLFVALLVFWTSSLTDDNGETWDEFFNFDNSFIGDSDDEVESNLLADPNGPEIILEDNNTEDGSTEKAYEVLSESVVSISVYEEDEEPSNSVPTSEGTGIIISEDGYIVTNSHVILDDIESNVWITTKSGDVYPVGIVGCDVRTDLAVLKCDSAYNWQYATFADSDQLKVGQDVVAIGSPGGSDYSSSLTRGIISALDRPLSGSAVTYIQTDAAINPGNSGGPLANMNGQVVGINTIKVVDTQYEGMGFAIPSITIKEVADELIKNGYVTGRARLGITVSEFSESYAKYYDAEAGVKIASIENDSPLKDTKAKVGDIITEIDGKSVASLNELYSVLDTYQPGDTVELTIYRFDEGDSSKNKEFTVEVELLGD